MREKSWEKKRIIIPLRWLLTIVLAFFIKPVLIWSSLLHIQAHSIFSLLAQWSKMYHMISKFAFLHYSVTCNSMHNIHHLCCNFCKCLLGFNFSPFHAQVKLTGSTKRGALLWQNEKKKILNLNEREPLYEELCSTLIFKSCSHLGFLCVNEIRHESWWHFVQLLSTKGDRMILVVILESVFNCPMSYLVSHRWLFLNML